MATLLLALIVSLRVLARCRGQICGSGGLSGRTTGITVGSRVVTASPERHAGEVAFAAANTLLHKQWQGVGGGGWAGLGVVMLPLNLGLPLPPVPRSLPLTYRLLSRPVG
jgi:hypothetical protein